MTDGKERSGLEQAVSTASTVKGAVKTGKAIAGLAKGAAGGPAGVAAAVFENRHTVAKVGAVLLVLLLLPVLFVLMLPSVIFGGLTAEYIN